MRMRRLLSGGFSGDLLWIQTIICHFLGHPKTNVVGGRSTEIGPELLDQVRPVVDRALVVRDFAGKAVGQPLHRVFFDLNLRSYGIVDRTRYTGTRAFSRYFDGSRNRSRPYFHVDRSGDRWQPLRLQSWIGQSLIERFVAARHELLRNWPQYILMHTRRGHQRRPAWLPPLADIRPQIRYCTLFFDLFYDLLAGPVRGAAHRADENDFRHQALRRHRQSRQ